MTAFDYDEEHLLLATVKDISPYKKSEEALWESENRFRSLVETTSDWIWETDARGVYTYSSPSAENILGYTTKEILGKTPFDFILPEESEEIATIFQRILANREPIVRLENTNRHKDGRIVILETSGTPFFNFLGQLLGYRGVDRDITERKLAEETLRMSEERFRSFVENANDIVYSLTPDGVFTYVSPNWTEILGHNAQEVVGQSFRNFVHPEDISRCYVLLKQIIVTGEKINGVEYRVKHKNGSWRWHVSNASSICNTDGKIISFIGIGRDITERKRFEAKIRLNEARLESLLKINQYSSESIQELLDFALDEAIALTSSKIGYIYFYNENKKEFTLNTWSKEVMKECTVVQPQTIYQLEKTGIWGEAVRQARPIMVNDFAAPNPLKKGLPEGHSKLHKYLTIPVFSEGRIVAVVAVANKSDDYNDSDIRQLNLMMDAVWKVVQRKKIEEELKESEARLRELNFTKDKFFSIIAHDLKNPFNCIIGYSDLMVEQIQEKNYEEIDEYARIIQKSSLQAMDLLANLLEWSRLQTGKIKFNPESIEIAALINEVTELLIPSAQQKSISISKEVQQNISVIVDKYMISTILRNLISNAIKFTNPGGKIVISAEHKQNELMITVSDNGVGIPKDTLEKLFQLGESNSTTGTQNEKGTGLGLLLCKDFVEKHEGKIWAESEHGKGSIFKFILPTGF